MGTSKHDFVQAIHAAAPPPYQLPIESVEFRMTVLEDHVPHDYDSDCAVVPPTWFSVTLTAPTRKRYLYLVQKEIDTGLIVVIMMFDRGIASGCLIGTYERDNTVKLKDTERVAEAPTSSSTLGVAG